MDGKMLACYQIMQSFVLRLRGYDGRLIRHADRCGLLLVIYKHGTLFVWALGTNTSSCSTIWNIRSVTNENTFVREHVLHCWLSI